MFSLDTEEADWPEEIREKVADLLERRNAFLKVMTTLNHLRILHLRDPEEVTAEQLKQYAAAKVEPLREAQSELIRDLLDQSVDTEKLIQLLPMLGLAVSGSIDVRMILLVLGLDDQLISHSISALREYFASGS